jgi:hypothetical protein
MRRRSHYLAHLVPQGGTKPPHGARTLLPTPSLFRPSAASFEVIETETKPQAIPRESSPMQTDAPPPSPAPTAVPSGRVGESSAKTSNPAATGRAPARGVAVEVEPAAGGASSEAPQVARPRSPTRGRTELRRIVETVAPRLMEPPAGSEERPATLVPSGPPAPAPRARTEAPAGPPLGPAGRPRELSDTGGRPHPEPIDRTPGRPPHPAPRDQATVNAAPLLMPAAPAARPPASGAATAPTAPPRPLLSIGTLEVRVIAPQAPAAATLSQIRPAPTRIAPRTRGGGREPSINRAFGVFGLEQS